MFNMLSILRSSLNLINVHFFNGINEGHFLPTFLWS